MATANATDIASAIRSAEDEPNQSNGGYFELGANIEYLDSARIDETNSGIGVLIAGAYYYRGAFIEAAHSSYDGVNLGYNFWNSKDWSIDFLAASVFGEYHQIDDDDEFDDSKKNKELLDRSTLYNASGFRFTYYLNNYIFQYRLVADIFDNHGVTSSARLGRSWQIRNWNFHGLLGVNYHSAKNNQYLWGVEEDKSTERFTAYKPSASANVTSEIGVTYPISENWVFKSTMQYSYLPSQVTNSPLADDHDFFKSETSISYVF